jgi:SMC interacting uncharacterized protein involved in chromosome segregation
MSEMVTMTIARALKEKNRVAGKLSSIRNRIYFENSKADGDKRDFDVNALVKVEKELQDRLIEIKKAISIVNAGIAFELIRLSEIKSEIEWWKKIPTKAGTWTEGGYRDTPAREVTFTAIVSNQDVYQKVEALQTEAENLQDRIDEYNASTKIEVPAPIPSWETTCKASE